MLASACALTIGNFDGVHRGHQAMLALLNNEARHRGVPSCVMTFEPHPRDFFAQQQQQPDLSQETDSLISHSRLLKKLRIDIIKEFSAPKDRVLPAQENLMKQEEKE
jgi:FAD synthase